MGVSSGENFVNNHAWDWFWRSDKSKAVDTFMYSI